MSKPRPPIHKAIMVGPGNAGKTCLLRRYLQGIFVERNVPTIGLMYALINETRTEPLNVRYALWDTGGAEMFRSIWISHYRGAQVALLVYDITSEWSFQSATTSWRQDILRHAPEAHVIFVGTKTDLEEDRVISTERGQVFANQCGFTFFETSSATGHNIDALFWEIAFIMARLQRSAHLELSMETMAQRVRPSEPECEVKRHRCCVIM